MEPHFQREFLLRLPLPWAQLYGRAYHAKDARARHDNAFYLFEALIKLTAAPLVAGYLQEAAAGMQPRQRGLDQLLAQLALPSLGQWVAILRELARYFGTRVDAAAHPLGHLWEQLNVPHRDLPATLVLFRRIKNGPDSAQPAGDSAVSLLALLDALVQYRNAVFGHGGPRLASFFEQEMGPLLFPAVNEILAEGVVHWLGPWGTRLVFLTELRAITEGAFELGLRELVGISSERTAPLALTPEQAARLAPQRVAVLWPGRNVPLALDPLLTFRESELTDEMLFLNRDRNGRQVEYLSYTTGRIERDQQMLPAVARLLSLVANRVVTEEEVKAFQEQSLAETPSVETLMAAPATSAVRSIGDYDILAEIGRGGMGVVYLAQQLSLGRIVALKMLPADLAADEMALARFRREMRALGRCDHPNIVKVLASGTLPEGQLFYAMEYVPGADLEHVWRELSAEDVSREAATLGTSTWARAVLTAAKKQRTSTTRRRGGEPTEEAASPSQSRGESNDIAKVPLPPLPEIPDVADDPGGYARRVSMLVRDAALAVQAVHDQGIVHRDVKPANLMLTSDGLRVVLMDFGLAKGQSLSLTRTSDRGFLGTLRYAAPEQLAAAKVRVDQRADVRALGVTLWELLTRRRAFADAEDEQQLAAWVLQKNLPLLRSIDSTLSPDLEAIAARATERDPDARIASARQLAEYLDLYLENKPLPIRPPSLVELSRRWVREHRSLVTSAASALALVIVTVAIAFGLITHSRNQEVDARKEAQRQEGIAKEKEADAKEKESQAKASEASERKAKQAEQTQRERAEAAVTAERAAREEEARQRQVAEAQERLASIRLYGSQLNRAKLEWEAGNRPVAVRQLEQCRHDLRGWEFDYLLGLFQPRQITLRGHQREVSSVAYSHDGARFVSGSGDKTLKVWDAASGRELFTLEGHKSEVSSVAYSPDGKSIVSGGGDDTVRLWNATTGAAEKTIKANLWSVHSVAFSPDGKWVAAGGDETVKIIDAASGELVQTLRGHTSYVSSLAYSPDGQSLVSGSWDGTIKVWNTADGTEARTIKGHVGRVESVALSADGKTLASGGADAVIRLWILTTGEELRSLKGHTGKIRGLAFNREGTLLVSCSDDDMLKVWNTESGREAMVLNGDTRLVTCVAFSPDGQRILSSGGEHTLKFWDVGDADEMPTFEGHIDVVRSVGFSAAGDVLASAGGDGMLRIWDANTRKEKHTHRVALPLGACFAVSPDGRHIAHAAVDAHVRVWDFAADAESAKLTSGDTAAVTAIAFSPDGLRLATVNRGGTLRIWNAQTGTEIRSIKAKEWLRSVAFSPNGQQLAGGDMSGTLYVWDAASGGTILTVKAHSVAITQVSFSPDGKQLAEATVNGDLAVWNIASGVRLLNPEGHTRGKPINGLAFSPDGRRLASCSSDDTLKVWDTATGAETLSLKGGMKDRYKGLESLAYSPDGLTIVAGGSRGPIQAWSAPGSAPTLTLRGHTGYVTSIAFSPDRQHLASGSNDRTVKIWDFASGQVEHTLRGHDTEVTSVAYSPSGNQIVSGERSSTLKLWDAAKGTERKTLAAGVYQVYDVSFGAKEDQILSISADRTLRVWDAATGENRRLNREPISFTGLAVGPEGKLIATGGDSLLLWNAEKGEVLFKLGPSTKCVALTPDGSQVVGGTTGGVLTVWNTATGEKVHELSGHSAPVQSIAYSPDGKRLASGDQAGRLKIWDPNEGKTLVTIKAHLLPITDVAYSGDGKYLASSSLDGTIKIWTAEGKGISRHAAAAE